MSNFNHWNGPKYDDRKYTDHIKNFLSEQKNIELTQDKLLEKMYMDDYYLYKADGMFSNYENCSNRRSARIKLDVNLFIRAIVANSTNDYFIRHIYWPLIRFGAHENGLHVNLSDLQDKVICFTEDSMQMYYHVFNKHLIGMNEPEKYVIIAFNYLLYDKDQPEIAHITNVSTFKQNKF